MHFSCEQNSLLSWPLQDKRKTLLHSGLFNRAVIRVFSGWTPSNRVRALLLENRPHHLRLHLV